MNDKVAIAKDLLSELLDKIGLEKKELSASVDNEGRILLTIKSPEPAVIIGYHGENLNSLQTVIQLILFRRFNEWVPILVDVDGYRKARVEKIRAIAKRAAEKARFLSTAITLPPMPPAERREVHLTILDIPGIVSISIDEGAQRRVVIKPEEEGTCEEPIKELEGREQRDSTESEDSDDIGVQDTPPGDIIGSEPAEI